MNRLRSAALAAVAVALAGGANTLSPGLAQAAPADVHVRIEGVFRTVYDRVVRTDGHAIRATSDTTDRRCDGTNADRNPTAGPTATGAAVDAMTLIGQTFDADWYRGFDDYFITQFADEAQDSGKGWFWGILVNRVFTPVGGCQFQVKTGDEVLWINNGFNGRPFLELSGPKEAVAGTPVTVNVAGTSSSEATTGTPKPYAGATVSPVDADGQPAPAGVANPATSAADGQAQVTFAKTGWQRLKARHPDGTSAPKAIASNSIDICVKAFASAPPCAGSPPSQIPAGVQQPEPVDPTPTLTPVPTPTPSPVPSPTPAPSPAPVPTPTPSPSTPLSQPGPVAPTPLPSPEPTPKPAPVTVPIGPAGRAWKAFADDRAATVRRVRGWTTVTDAGAWQRTASRGKRGATLAVRLPAGRPVVLLRGVTRTARIELRSGKVRQRITVRGRRSTASRGVTLRKGVPAGTLTLKVLDGVVRFDGAGTT